MYTLPFWYLVRRFLLKIFAKLGVSNRVELLFLTLYQPASSAQTLAAAHGAKKA